MIVFLFRGAVLGGEVLYRRDINMVWLPQVEVFVRCIAAGSWPLWDPYSGFGRPLLADPRAEIAYPLTWLNLVMSPGSYYTLFVVLHLATSGLGLYLLARRWRISALGAFVAGAVWIASGPLLSLASMWHHLAGAAWIPWIFLAADTALDSGRISHALLWGAVLAAQILAGSPDFTALTLAVLAPYVLCRRPPWRAAPNDTPRHPLGVAVLAVLFGLALSALQWIPTLEWVLQTGRPLLSYRERTTWSLHPAALSELIAPLSWSSLPLSPRLQAALLEFREPWLHSIFLGAPALALVTASFLSNRPRRRFLVVVALASVLVSMGRYSVVYDGAAFLIPPLRMLRYPVKAMVVAAFAWSLLAGFGTDVWRGSRAHSRRAWSLAVLAPTALVLILAAAAAVGMSYGAEMIGMRLLANASGNFAGVMAAVASRLALTAALAGFVLLLALIQRRRLSSGSWPSITVACLAVGTLLAVHHDLHWTGPRELFRVRPPVLPLLEQPGLPRLYVYDYSMSHDDSTGTGRELRANRQATEAYSLARIPAGWATSEALVLGVHFYLNPPTAARWSLPGSFDRDILGFEPLPLTQLNESLRKAEGTPAHLRLLRIGGVRNVLALLPATWWKDLAPVAAVQGLFERPIQVFAVPEPLPRSYVVGGVRVADGAQAQVTLADPGFEPNREVVLPAGAPRAAAASPGISRILEMRPDQVRLEADLAEAGYVVLLDGYDPGWKASVDDQPVPVLRANAAFRAVLLPAGRHRIEYVYRPRAVIAGAALSGASLLAGLGWTFARRRRSGIA
jgi:hypothetical protein